LDKRDYVLLKTLGANHQEKKKYKQKDTDYKKEQTNKQDII
jgi:hypothetical protein